MSTKLHPEGTPFEEVPGNNKSAARSQGPNDGDGKRTLSHKAALPHAKPYRGGLSSANRAIVDKSFSKTSQGSERHHHNPRTTSRSTGISRIAGVNDVQNRVRQVRNSAPALSRAQSRKPIGGEYRASNRLHAAQTASSRIRTSSEGEKNDPKGTKNTALKRSKQKAVNDDHFLEKPQRRPHPLLDRDSPYKKTRKGTLKLKPEHSPPKKQANPSSKSPKLGRNRGGDTAAPEPESASCVGSPQSSTKRNATDARTSGSHDTQAVTGASDTQSSIIIPTVTRHAKHQADPISSNSTSCTIANGPTITVVKDAEYEDETHVNSAHGILVADSTDTPGSRPETMTTDNNINEGVVTELTVTSDKGAETAVAHDTGPGITNRGHTESPTTERDNAVTPTKDRDNTVTPTTDRDNAVTSTTAVSAVARADQPDPIATTTSHTEETPTRTPAQIARDKRMAKKAKANVSTEHDTINKSPNAQNVNSFPQEIPAESSELIAIPAVACDMPKAITVEPQDLEREPNIFAKDSSTELENKLNHLAEETSCADGDSLGGSMSNTQVLQEEPQDLDKDLVELEEEPEDLDGEPQDLDEVPKDLDEASQDLDGDSQDLEMVPEDKFETSHDLDEEPQNVDQECQYLDKAPAAPGGEPQGLASASADLDVTPQDFDEPIQDLAPAPTVLDENTQNLDEKTPAIPGDHPDQDATFQELDIERSDLDEHHADLENEPDKVLNGGCKATVKPFDLAGGAADATTTHVQRAGTSSTTRRSSSETVTDPETEPVDGITSTDAHRSTKEEEAKIRQENTHAAAQLARILEQQERDRQRLEEEVARLRQEREEAEARAAQQLREAEEQRALLAKEKERKLAEQCAERLALEKEARELAELRRQTEEQKQRLREEAAALQAARAAHEQALAESRQQALADAAATAAVQHQPTQPPVAQPAEVTASSVAIHSTDTNTAAPTPPSHPSTTAAALVAPSPPAPAADVPGDVKCPNPETQFHVPCVATTPGRDDNTVVLPPSDDDDARAGAAVVGADVARADTLLPPQPSASVPTDMVRAEDEHGRKDMSPDADDLSSTDPPSVPPDSPPMSPEQDAIALQATKDLLARAAAMRSEREAKTRELRRRESATPTDARTKGNAAADSRSAALASAKERLLLAKSKAQTLGKSSPHALGISAPRPNVVPTHPTSSVPPSTLPPVTLRPHIATASVTPSGSPGSPRIGRAEALRRARERAQQRRTQSDAAVPSVLLQPSTGAPLSPAVPTTPRAPPSMDFYSDDSDDDNDGSTNVAVSQKEVMAVGVAPKPPPSSSTLRSEASAIAREKRAKALAAKLVSQH
eukprot:m.402901 g.402901  ORF g.402901 m.402901 type:complete len:1334 (+) comp21186_c0_seq3:255-4256(+)